MIKEKIYEILDEMLKNPKSKPFLNHLVRSYMPVNQIEKVWDKPTGDFKCVITRAKLISVQEIFNGIRTDQFKDDLMKHLKGMWDENSDVKSPMGELLCDKMLGFTGKDTTTFMSYEVAQEFYNWIITKSLTGDKHINWLLGSIRRDSFSKRASHLRNPEVQAKLNKGVKTNNSSATFTLGDSSDALAKLKAKMEAEGNN